MFGRIFFFFFFFFFFFLIIMSSVDFHTFWRPICVSVNKEGTKG